ncbi:MAG: hypothetical protein JJ855_08435 [Rhodospirillales bacterium]|nr:hypothetical protein [Rhodospirillales bacterium]
MNAPSKAQQELDSHYAQLRTAIDARNPQRSATHLKGMFDLLPKHPDHVAALLRDLFANGLGLQDYVNILTVYKSTYPEDPTGYLMAMGLLREQGALDQVRLIWQEACAKASHGFHFQPAVQASVFDAENGQHFTAVSTSGLGVKLKGALGSFISNASREPDGLDSLPATSGPAVETCSPDPLDTGAATFNGIITGFHTPTNYYFRYGMTPDNLDGTTERRNVPGPVNGRVMDTGDNLFKRITAYAARVTFGHPEPKPGTDTDITALLEWPFGKDRNHRNGIGIIDLVVGWKSAAHDRPRATPPGTAATFPTEEYPGEGIDLRDCVFSVTYRCDAFDQRQFRPVAWIHGRTGTAVLPDQYDDLAAWACTHHSQDAHLLSDGKWQRMTFHLPAHSLDWSFCGSNTEEMGDTMARYTYAPIQNLQRNNTSGNICLAFIGEKELETPEGDIELASLELTYRSRSLLAPGQGSVYAGDAATHRSDPSFLTDGSIGIPSQYWIDDFEETKGCALTWKLRTSSEIDCVKLHQNPLAPADRIEISFSSDGITFAPVWSGALDNVPDDPSAWGDLAANGEGSGLCKIIVFDAPTHTAFMRVRILSSHRCGIVGLDAVEVFSNNFEPMPDGAPVTLSELVNDLPMGATVFAQLVAENTDGIFSGEVVSVTLPDNSAPQILGANILPEKDGGLRLKIRTRAAGSTTRLEARLQGSEKDLLAKSSTNVGKWDAPRDTVIHLPSHADAVQVQIKLTSSAGEDTLQLSLS